MEKIKNILKSKVTIVALACLLLVGVFAGISALATEGTPEFAIVGRNINHAVNASLVYKVEVSGITGKIDSYDDYEMRFWYDNIPTNLNSKPNHTATVAQSDGYSKGSEILYFESEGIAPKDMTKVVYAAVFYKGEAVTSLDRYSVFEYVVEMGANENKTPAQAALYEAMENYIIYARTYLGYVDGISPDQIGYVQVSNGYIQLRNGDNVIENVEKTTSMALLLGQGFRITFDYKGYVYRVENETVVPGYGYCDYFDGYLTKEDPDRHYAPMGYNIFTVPAVENASLISLSKTTQDVGYAKLPLYIPKSYLTAGSSVKAGEYKAANDNVQLGIYALSATPTDAEGKYFSHWELDGEIIDNDELLILNSLVDLSNNGGTVTFAPEAVYSAVPDRVFDNFSCGLNANTPASAVTVLENGFSIQKPSGTTGLLHNNATSTNLGTNKVEKMVFSTTINMEKAENHDTTATGTDRKKLYTTSVGQHIFGAYVRLGGDYVANNPNELIGVSGVLVNNGDIQLCVRYGNGTRQFNTPYDKATALTGQDNKLTFVAYTNHTADNIELTELRVYLNGNLVMSSPFANNGGATYKYENSNKFQFKFETGNAFFGKFTVTDPKFVEFYKD